MRNAEADPFTRRKCLPTMVTKTRDVNPAEVLAKLAEQRNRQELAQKSREEPESEKPPGQPFQVLR